MSSYIIPDTLLDRYLATYNDNQITAINAEYAVIRDLLLTGAQASPNGDKTLLMTAGSPGTGKSSHLANEVRNARRAGTTFVLIDSDAVLEMLPAFKAHQLDATLYHSHDDQLKALRDATKIWLPAAKYICDRLVNDCAERGLSIAFETTAHAPGIRNFFENARKAGYFIDLHYCDAQPAVKRASCKVSFNRDHKPHVSDADIARKTVDVENNLFTLTQADRLTLLWRAPITGAAANETPAQAEMRLASAPIHQVARIEDDLQVVIAVSSAQQAFDEARGAGKKAEDLMRLHCYARAMSRRQQAAPQLINA